MFINAVRTVELENDKDDGIWIDGFNLSLIPLHTLRSHITIVPQVVYCICLILCY